MHPKAKEWDDRNASKWIEDILPMGRPCDWCGMGVTMGYIHVECIPIERDNWEIADKVRRAGTLRAGGSRRYGGNTARTYSKAAKQSLTR